MAQSATSCMTGMHRSCLPSLGVGELQLLGVDKFKNARRSLTECLVASSSHKLVRARRPIHLGTCMMFNRRADIPATEMGVCARIPVARCSTAASCVPSQEDYCTATSQGGAPPDVTPRPRQAHRPDPHHEMRTTRKISHRPRKPPANSVRNIENHPVQRTSTPAALASPPARRTKSQPKWPPAQRPR